MTVPQLSQLLRVATDTDNKYTRGVLGLVIGSSAYPGAALLGVNAAIHNKRITFVDACPGH
jgi:NAD(P)H-hydrate repair Nnr-like enzyme with NAD(P)H-hydrate dehydratase domain